MKKDYRCQKCNIEISYERWLILEVACMAGNCPTDEINKKKGCKLCGACYDKIRRTQMLDKLN